MKNCLLFFYIMLLNLAFSQDFNNYIPLKSQGEIPKDFLDESYKKVSEQQVMGRTEIGNQFDQREFLIMTRYSIDALLQSGTVLFGDEITSYVENVAHKILESKPALKSELRFYVVRSNEANAFSTDQGIIFVTTGFISRIESEAQLAFVLAHEISHYTEKHVVKGFVWQKNEQYSNTWLRQMSIYSKDKELEADRLGMELYRKAGYGKDEIKGVFQMLSISHLPFMNEVITQQYFETDKLKLEKGLFIDTVAYEIKNHEDESDSLSSHPNSLKRQMEIEKLINESSGVWGTAIQFFGTDKFNYIQQIARFEYVRNAVLNANYAESLYSIYLLEKEVPNSIYLDRLKAQTWLGLYRYSDASEFSSQIISEEYYEGEIAKVYDFLKNLSFSQLKIVALRYLYDIKQKNVEDKEVTVIYESFVSELSTDKYFSKILKKYNSTSKDSLSEELQFWNGIQDIVNDSVFQKRFLKEKEVIADEKFTMKKVLSVEPRVISYTKNGLDIVRSEKMEEMFADGIKLGCTKAGIETINVNRREYAKLDIEKFNEHSLYMNYFMQLGNNKKIKPFPVDYTSLVYNAGKYGTSNIMFNFVTHTFDPEIKWYWLVGLSYIAPVGLAVYLPERIISGTKTELYTFIYDCETGKEVYKSNQNYNEPLNEYSLGARVYNLFQSLKTK